MSKIGLVMEGGAMRGMFTAGVTDVMMEHKIKFDGAVGVSAGAAFGCNYKSNQIGRAIRYNMQYCRDPRYCSFRSLLKTGDLYGADFCYHELPEKLDPFDVETFADSPMEFYVVCTDVLTGEAVYQKCETAQHEDLEWMRASASMPLVSRIVTVGGYQLLDGGIADSVPLRYFESIGYTKNVVILTQPRGYQKSRNKAIGIMKLAMRRYPNLVKTMEHRHEIYNETVQYVFEAEKTGDAFVICPEKPLPIGRIERDPEKLREVYEIGRGVAEKNLEKLQEFLK